MSGETKAAENRWGETQSAKEQKERRNKMSGETKGEEETKGAEKQKERRNKRSEEQKGRRNKRRRRN